MVFLRHRLWLTMIVLLACLALLPFWELLLDPNRILVTRDLMINFLPAKFFEWQSIFMGGTVPRWNPLLSGGVPFRADLSTGNFYFMNFVFPILGLNRITYAFSWYVALHLPLAVLGMFTFLRSFSLQRSVSLLTAFLFSISAFLVSTANVPNILASFVALPFFFASLRTYRRKNSSFALIGAAFCLGWPLYAGSPDFTIFAALCSPFFFFRCQWQAKEFFRFALFFSIGILFLLPLIIPFAELIRHSKHAEMNLHDVLSDSFHPLRFFELFLPELWGNFYPRNTYIGRPLVNGLMDFPFVFNCYLGFFLPTLLCLSLFYQSWRKNRMIVCSAILLFLMALGSRGLIYRLLAENISLWRSFRYPEKWIGLAVLPILLLMANGFQRMRAIIRQRKASNSIYFFFLFPLACSVLAAIFFRDSAVIFFSLLRFSILQSSFLLLFYLANKSRISSQLFFVSLAFIFFADQISNSVNYAWGQPISVLKNPTAEKIQLDIQRRAEEIKKGAAYRFYSKGDFNGLEAGFVPDTLDFIGRTAWISTKNFVPNSSMIYGLSSVSIYSAIADLDHLRWWNNLAGMQGNRLLNLMGAYYLIKPLPNIGFERNEDALAFVMQAKKLESMNSYDAALARLREPSWNPKESVIVETTAIPLFSSEAVNFEVERGIDRISIRSSISAIKQANPLFLVNERYSIHWVCEPDCEVLGRANGWAMLIYVKNWRASGIHLRFL